MIYSKRFEQKYRLPISRFIGALVYFSAGLVLLVSCSSAASETDQQIAALQEWHSWLRSNPCAPPCWYDIVPGKTDSSTAIAKLDELTFINDLDVQTGTVGTDIVARGSGAESSMLGYRGEPPMLTRIRVGNGRRIPLSLVEERFGSPTHVLALANLSSDRSHNVYKLYLIYARDGFALPWRGNGGSTQPQIALDKLEYYVVVLFEPSLEGFATAEFDLDILSDVLPFEEHAGFESFCRGNAC